MRNFQGVTFIWTRAYGEVFCISVPLSVFLTFTPFFQKVIEKDMFRSSHWRCSVTKDVLRNFSKFTGKHMCQLLFFNKVAGLLFNKVAGFRPATLSKKRLWHWCFLVIFAKFEEHFLLQNTSGGCFCML